MKNFTLVAALALSMAACSPKQAPKEKAAPVFVEANLKVEGMSCDGCELTISKGVSLLAGIDSISANHEDSTAFVRFDSTQIKLNEIYKAIEERGYVVASK